MVEHVYRFDIAMSCGGCSGAVDRVLKKLQGVKSYNVSLENQSAEVTTNDDSLDYTTVLQTIQKTGKKVKAGFSDGKEIPLEPPAAPAGI